ncbi:conserved oligomeric Golgi complex subunit 2 [Tribolium castaneum]|uniref:Conserved oligomeric Golgi complex subunit 2 n=1 Tax=Tribolium castaneum TaxID=7070 RepID=D6W7T3_TRICA|nr:PREDICTED: conserved oligomeric Golgi complex subunit 2 [Tribolium castaneum]EFA11346.2 Conserved oligomeric Golgi complex subunit 2-like Protein [Tribolium castaneum]|eukprot:XP_973896.2 PREDICTED: conserved oligomeric Golgi complex subunit 2 [Tribolium castaneum]
MEPTENLVWKESFFKENFNVDQCLSKYTLKSDLETLRNDLKNYGNDLHQQMAEILKTETEAIVNLAEYLTNLNSKIDDLSLPLRQLREEIKTLYDLIKSAEESYFTTLETIKNNNTRRNYLNLKFGIISSALYIDNMIKTHEDDLFDDSVILERAVNKYSFEFNYLEAFHLVSDVEEISFVGKKLTDMVNKVFLKSVKNNDEDLILRCLQMYDNLGEQKEAEKTYQVHIVRPALRHLFTETYLETCNQDVKKIYDEALHFIDSKLITLLNVLKRNAELKSFNFILNSFWAEVDKLSRDGLPYITAPGNPELFQKRFKSTWNFLREIAVKCGDDDLIQTNKSFQNHIKRFNLPVYFEIRFQQIAGQFETDAIAKPGTMYSDSNEINCSLKITLALWTALKTTFNDEVFINNLADQFLKLSMLLLARYLKWFEVALQESDSFSDGSDAWEGFIIHSICDLKVVKGLIGHEPDGSTIYSIMPLNIKPILVKVFQVNSNSITDVISKLQNHLISIKSRQSLAHLQSVASIPRLYRRTNRSAPKDASNYMVEAIQPILKFHDKFKSNMTSEIQTILDTVITNNTKQYLTLVEEVLRSVCKTEESLRRLKNRNTQVSEAVSEADKMSDEMKIREQIKLDVCYFVDKLYPLAMDAARKCMDDLKSKTFC